jgi:hypothetical protein
MIRNLHKDIILRIEFIHAHCLFYWPEKQNFSWGTTSQWSSGHAKVNQVTQLDPLLVTFVTVNLVTEGGFLPRPQEKYLVPQNQPYLTGGHFWVKPTKWGQAVIPIWNCALYELDLVMNLLVFLKTSTTAMPMKSNPSK